MIHELKRQNGFRLTTKCAKLITEGRSSAWQNLFNVCPEKIYWNGN